MAQKLALQWSPQQIYTDGRTTDAATTDHRDLGQYSRRPAELTRGHVVIMGHHTFTSVPDFAFTDRDILEIHASDRPEDVLARFPSRVWDINRLPYNGEADRWFDPAWLVAGSHRL